MGRNPIPRGHRALRRGRVSCPGHYYLVTTVTANRRPVFQNLRLGRLVVHSLRKAEPQATTKCFVVMPDHLHWLFQLRGNAELSATVGGLKAGSARSIRQHAPHIDQVWQRGFHDQGIRNEIALRTMARYVIANPLRAGLVERVGDYPLWDAVWVE